MPTDASRCSERRREGVGTDGLLRNFQRACRRAKITKKKFHGLRAFFITELFRRGASARAVQELAGHIHLSTTQRYAFVGEKDRRDAIALLA